MKNVDGTIEIKDAAGNVIKVLPIKEYIDEIMQNDHELPTEIRRAVIYG